MQSSSLFNILDLFTTYEALYIWSTSPSPMLQTKHMFSLSYDTEIRDDNWKQLASRISWLTDFESFTPTGVKPKQNWPHPLMN